MRIFITVVAILLLLVALMYLVTGGDIFMSNNNEQVAEEETEDRENDTEAPLIDSVLLAVLDTQGETDGTERGCDHVVLVERDIAPTTAPLTAALETLFAIQTEDVDGWTNFIARTNGTLAFDRARVENGVAHIYLTGELSGLAGVCDNPRAAIQIEETALQFDTVSSVQLYLNGEATELIPSQR